MKTLFRFVFATFLATTVYYYSNGSESNGQVLVQTEMAPDDYKIVDPNHPNFGLVASRSTIESLCPSTGQTCAMKVNNPEDLIEWDGGSTKF